MTTLSSELDPPQDDGDSGVDLEEFQAQTAAGGNGEPRMGEADAPQGAEQHIGHCGELQAGLVGGQGSRCGRLW